MGEKAARVGLGGKKIPGTRWGPETVKTSPIPRGVANPAPLKFYRKGK